MMMAWQKITPREIQDIVRPAGRTAQREIGLLEIVSSAGMQNTTLFIFKAPCKILGSILMHPKKAY